LELAELATARAFGVLLLRHPQDPGPRGATNGRELSWIAYIDVEDANTSRLVDLLEALEDAGYHARLDERSRVCVDGADED